VARGAGGAFRLIAEMKVAPNVRFRGQLKDFTSHFIGQFPHFKVAMMADTHATVAAPLMPSRRLSNMVLDNRRFQLLQHR
jgi:hypothetical protein